MAPPEMFWCRDAAARPARQNVDARLPDLSSSVPPVDVDR
jgi:hypothetical protein